MSNHCNDDTIENLEGNSPEISYGGVTRTIFRNFMRRVGGNQHLFIPHPRTVAKSADKLSDLIAFRDQFRTARDSHQTAMPFLPKTWAMLKHIAPGLIKSSIAGTIVFSSYEYSYGRYNVSKFEPNHNATMTIAQSDSEDLAAGITGTVVDGSLRLTTTIASFCGIAGGLLGASFNLMWDHITRRVDFRGRFPKLINHPKNVIRPLPIVGTLMFHAVVTGTLFGTYECAKNVLFRSASLFDVLLLENEEVATDSIRSSANSINNSIDSSNNVDDNDDFHMSYYLRKNRYLLFDIIGIATAGYISGLVSETVGYYLNPLESSNLMLQSTASHQHRVYETRKVIRMIRNMPAPTLGSIFTAAIPCSLGFLAYEFGKSEFE